MARRSHTICWAAALLVASASVVAATAGNAPSTTTTTTTKTLTGKACSKSGDAACTRCTLFKAKGRKPSFTCTACATGAELNDSGRCVCPAGYGATGTANTVNNLGTSHNKNNKKKAVVGCSACAVDAFAANAAPVRTARCSECANGESTDGQTGQAQCVPGGCTPLVCGDVGAPECGSGSDGCGGTISCTCAQGGNTQCLSSQCVCDPGYATVTGSNPLACAAAGVDYYAAGLTRDSVRVPCPLGTVTGDLVTTASSASQCFTTNGCSPCATTSPKTYFSTTSPNAIYYQQALDPITATVPPNAQLLCAFPTSDSIFGGSTRVEDVASPSASALVVSLSNPEVVIVLDPAAQSASAPCVYTVATVVGNPLPALEGLGAGIRSDVLYAVNVDSPSSTYLALILSQADGGPPVLTTQASSPFGPISTTDVDITAVPGLSSTTLYIAAATGSIKLTDVNPTTGIPAGAQALVVGNIGAGAAAAWCTSSNAFAGSVSTTSAYTFGPGSTFVVGGITTMTASFGTLTGAAVVPQCQQDS